MEYNPDRIPYNRVPPDPDRDPLEVLSRRRLDVKERKPRARFYFAVMLLLAVTFYLPAPTATFGDQVVLYLHRTRVILGLLCLVGFVHNVRGMFENPQMEDFLLTREQRILLGLDPDVQAKPGALDCRPIHRKRTKEHPIRWPQRQQPHYAPKMKAFLQSIPYSEHARRLLKPKPLTPEEEQNRALNRRLDVICERHIKGVGSVSVPFDSAGDLAEVVDQQFQYRESKPKQPEIKLPHYPRPLEWRMAPFDDPKDILRRFPTINGIPVLKEWQFMQHARIQGSELFEWGDRAREWLYESLFKPVARKIEQIDQELKMNGLQHLDTAHCVNVSPYSLTNAFQAVLDARKMNLNQGYVSLDSERAAAFVKSTSMIGGPPVNLEDFARKFPKWDVAVDRLRLEVFLNVPGYPGAREYVARRIKTLASSYNLMNYVPTGGAPDWTYKKHPSDPELVCHLFCAALDLNIPMTNPGTLPFTRNHFVPPDGEVCPGNGMQIKQTRKAKHGGVHYVIVSKRVCYEMRPGIYNLFLTIAVFAWFINKNYGGYIGALNIKGNTIGIGRIFQQRNW